MLFVVSESNRDMIDKLNLCTRLYYAVACKELAGPISATLRLGSSVFNEEQLHLWRANSNFVFDLADPRIESKSPAPRAAALTTTPTGQLHHG